MLDGKKAKIGAISTMLTGAAVFLALVVSGDFTSQELLAAWAVVLVGWETFAFRDAMPTKPGRD